MEDFDGAVLAAIRQVHTFYGGARFPTVVPLWYSGDPTEAAHVLGLVEPTGKVALDAERRLFAAVKRLHAAGKVVFLGRWGYTWTVPAGSRELSPLKAGDELRAVPTDAPYYWSEL